MTCVLDFIKDQGIKNAKLVLEVIPTAQVEIPDNELGVTYSFKKEELKTLIDSVDFINDQYHGDIDKVNEHLSDMKRLSRLKPVIPNIHDKIKVIESHIHNWKSIYKDNNNEMDA